MQSQPQPWGTDAELARQLGVSRAAVSKLKKRGMPTSSLQEAQAWRDKNLNSLMRKDWNILRSTGKDAATVEAKTRRALEQLAKAHEAAHAALRAGLFDALKAPLQLAMRAIPDSARWQAQLAPAVWNALLVDYADILGPEPTAEDFDTRAKPRRRVTGQARTLYALAAGESIDRAWLDRWDEAW